MAITALNDYAIGDIDLTAIVNTLDKTYKGKADITISAYDTTAAPTIKVGSVFECNGALFIVDTSDITPTGYSGISNSTTFYLYFDESATAFIYSSTAPTWNDALQGWYNGNDRAFFSMYKDSGGTLYSGKSKLVNSMVLQTKVIPIGIWNMVSTATLNIKHGLNPDKIRNIEAIIIKDGNTFGQYKLNYLDSGGDVGGSVIVANTDSSELYIVRSSTGQFNSALFDDATINRGWITIWYVA